jgi:hypothetical protein
MFLSNPRETDVTFGTPGGNDPFSFSLHDFFKVDPGLMSEIGRQDSPDFVEINKSAEKFSAGAIAAERQTRLVDTINARDNALAEAADHRIRTVRDKTSVQLENPFRGGYELEARDRLGVPLTGASPIDTSRLGVAQRDIFNEKIDEIAQNHPDKAAAFNFGQSLEDQAQAIAKSAAYDGEHAEGGFVAAIAGGLWGSRRDPLFLGSLFAGPGAAVARTALGRIGWGAIKQGLFNAGLQAAAQPAVQDWRREIGEKNGVVPALENVGLAFLFGAIPGAAIEGAKVLNAANKAAVTRLLDGTASAEDVRTAAAATGSKLDDVTDREIRTAAADQANGTAAIARPADVPAAVHADLADQAVRHAEDPNVNPPPEIATPVPDRAADQVRVLDEAIPAALGDRQTVDGKPVTFARFDPRELQTDAAAFQYKGGGDAAGVTDRLKHVTEFDPLASGKTLVFERSDGTRVIADGHQRLGLAKRLDQQKPNSARAAIDTVIENSPATTDEIVLRAREDFRNAGGAAHDTVHRGRAIEDNFGAEGRSRYDAEIERLKNAAVEAYRRPQIKIDGFVFREKDGWTVEDVRAIAAKKNMQEGSGDALDAARMLRDRPDLLDGSMPLSSPMMKNAVALSRLSDEAFGMAINGVVPPNYAAAVGSMVPDRLQHASVLSDLVRFAPETEREARVLIGEIMSAGFRAEEQINLFGASQATRSLMGERVKVLDAALTALSKDKKLFGTLAEKADAIEAAGNQLARGTNDARARDAAQLQDMLTRLARRTGPVSDALNRAAAQMAEGMKPAKAADGFLDEVRTLLDRDGLSGLLASPELKPRLAVEPGSAEALAAAETARGERSAPKRPAAPPDSEFAKISTADLSLAAEHELGLPREEAGHPGFEDFIYDVLKPADVAAIRALPAERKMAELRAAIRTAADNNVYVQPLPDDMRVSVWTGEKWIPGGSVTDNGNTSQLQARAVDTIAAALYDAKGNRTIPIEQFDRLFAREWRGIREAPVGAPEKPATPASEGRQATPEAPQSHGGASEPGLFDSVAVATRDDGRDVRFISRDAALAEADKPAEHADLVAACKG